MSNCYKCGSPITFKRLANGKWCPTNPDGSDHWDVCRMITNRMASLPPRSADRPMMSEGHYCTGRDYDAAKVCVCRNDIPPWDVCVDCPTYRQTGIFTT